jgi:hypothetical protein
MTCPTTMPIHPTRVTKGDILNDPSKCNIPHLDYQMNVIGHQAKGMNAVPITLDAFLQ